MENSGGSKSSKQRGHPRRTAELKFVRKVELLEAWANARVVPPGQYWPTGPTDLARWKDPLLGLESWESPNIAAPNGKYSALRARFDKAVDTLREVTGQCSKINERKAKRDVKAQVKALIGQNLALHSKVGSLSKEVGRLKELLVIAERTEADLKAKLFKVAPFARSAR